MSTMWVKDMRGRWSKEIGGAKEGVGGGGGARRGQGSE